MSRLSACGFGLIVAGTLATTPSEAVQRAFVASYGNDANTASNCSFANPCRSFTAAQTVADAGGEIVALDAAGYGAVTITKSITITANPGFYAGISAASGAGVTLPVTLSLSAAVTLRNLTINSVGGARGIDMRGGNLTLENCVISNFADYGLYVEGPVQGIRIVDSIFRANGTGLWLQSGLHLTMSGSKVMSSTNVGIFLMAAPNGQRTRATISDSVIADNHTGISVHGNLNTLGEAALTRVTIANNSYGIAASSNESPTTTFVTLSASTITGQWEKAISISGTAEVRSIGNNLIDLNGSPDSGSITTIPAR